MRLDKARRKRLFRVYARDWQRRLLFIAGGLAVGVVAAGIALLADEAYRLFHNFQMMSPWVVLVLTPLGFSAILYVTDRFFPNSGGSGIPQAIAARSLSDPAERRKLVSLRIALGKIVLTLAGMLVGASTGREGPSVQVGASMMFALGRFSQRHQPGLILAGSAAGVAAAFNTPLAGIVFAIEEMSRAFEVKTSGLVIGTIVAAGLASMAVLGNYTYFGATSAALPHWQDWIAVPVCGIVGGLAGGLFSRVLILFGKGLPGRAGQWIKSHRIIFAAGCGFVVAISGILSGGLVYGTGYEQARAALHGTEVLPLYFAPLKLLATALSSISGIPGGIFSPSLSVGAGLGADLAWLFPATPIGVLVLLGMVGYFSGVVQAPITAFVIVAEMTDNHALLVPLMLTALIAQGTSRLICEEGVYHALAKNFLPEKAQPQKPQEELPLAPPSA